MAQQLKHFLGENIVRSIAHDLCVAHAPFRERLFIEACMAGLVDLELTQRAWHIADVMHGFLPSPFRAAAEVLIASLGPEIPATGNNGMAPFRYLPYVFYVQKYGLDDFEAAMQAQYELTKRFSAESSIRAFLVKYPDETYAQLLEWAQDEDAHVRRLASEGTRPRLPWAPRLPAFQKDPKAVIALLEHLKDDPELYVRRSVANNLNDIGKDNPEVTVEVCRRWLVGASAEREWIVRHALRSLVKRGHRGALRLLGVSAAPCVDIAKIRLMPARVAIGGKLRFSFEMTSTASRVQVLLIDFAVHFMKANGKTRPKVFKLSKARLAPAERTELSGTVSFERLTTRRHYPGRHCIELHINGMAHPLAEFEVRAA